MLRGFIQVIFITTLFFTGTFPVQSTRPVIRDVQILTPTLSRYDRFELRFDLTTSADHLSLPYDPNSPPGLEHISGVSADALFTAPSGRIYTQPAFFFQPYRYEAIGGRDHRVPAGPPHWRVRFTPQEEGTWQVRLRVTDRGGMTVTPGGAALSFTVSGLTRSPYRRHGFLRVSPADPRYFEFQDGTAFIPSGFNTGTGSQTGLDGQFQAFEDNKINFIRTWLSGEGINGSQWSPWASFYLPYDGYIPGVSLETADVFPGRDLAFRLDEKNPCLFQGWQQGPISVEPGQTYTLSARVKLTGVRPRAPSGGFAVKTGGWLEQACASAGTGTLVTQPVSGSRDWFEVSGSVTASGYFLDNLYLVLQDASGVALVDEVRLFRADDPARANLLRQPSADSHLSFEPLGADKWDAVLAAAEQHGVYLKLVIDEKNEWIRNHIGPDGKFTRQPDNANFYAAPGLKSRWLQQAWWRYIIARWGFSTAIHSFEYVNEGDPYSTAHYEAANSLARYIHRFDPSRHMVTTSFWHSFPGPEFWANPAYADIDYADVHAYITTGWEGGNASFLGKLKLDASPQNSMKASPSILLDAGTHGRYDITPRGLVLLEKGEWQVRYWMKAENFTARCPYNSTGSTARVRWMVDGGASNGGKEGVVPNNAGGKDFVCASPSGSFAWRQFTSDRDRDGITLPESVRLIIPDDLPHAFSLSIENYDTSGGTAWISNVELINPSGKVVPVIGQFDTTSFVTDTAWYNAAYGLLLGGGSPVGAGKPLVRGEAGLDDPASGGYLAEINRDSEGIWLHNNVWGQVGPGGIADLMWWTSETITENSNTGRVPGLLPVYAAYQNFMAGIPLTNGRYQDIRALVSDPRLRAWGQRDDAAGRAHLWIQNKAHTWQAAVKGTPIPAAGGTINLPGFPAGTYTIEWWGTYQTQNQVFKTENVTVTNGSLTLTLPEAILTDLAVKIYPN